MSFLLTVVMGKLDKVLFLSLLKTVNTLNIYRSTTI
jgi:hypothetical protein